MRLILVRHGEPNYQLDCLTSIGQMQAKAAAIRLENENISEIYSSPSGRAQQTAAATAEHLGLPVQILDFMHEISWGDPENVNFPMQGHPWNLADEMVENENYFFSEINWKEHPFFQKNQAVQCCNRVSVLFDSFLETHGYRRTGNRYQCISDNTDKSIGLFSHGGSGACVLSRLLNLPFPYVCRTFPYDFTSITVLTFKNGIGQFTAPRVELFNDAKHIDSVIKTHPTFNR